MIDLTNEEVLSLKEATKFLARARGGKKPHGAWASNHEHVNSGHRRKRSSQARSASLPRPRRANAETKTA